MSNSSKGKGVDRTAHRHYGSESDDSGDDYDDDDWKGIDDPAERRRIQNRLAQRKFRAKTKQAKEESMRESQNQAAARHAYSHPDPRDLDHGNASSGLPWGGPSIKHVIERGNARAQSHYSRPAGHSRGSSSRYGHDSRESRANGSRHPDSDRGRGESSVSRYSSSRGGEPSRGHHDSRASRDSDRRYHDSSSRYSGGRGGDYPR